MRGTNKKRFTEQMLERLSPPKAGRLEISDEVCPGLAVRVMASGRKTFSFSYKVPGEGGVSPSGRLLTGQQHRVTLGRHPIMTLVEARSQARDLWSVITQGRDPRTELTEKRRATKATTLQAVSQRFIDQEAKPNISNWRSIESTMRLHVLPLLGERPLAEIRRSDIHELLDNLVIKDRVGTAREVKKDLSRLFNWAIDREIVTSSPVAGLKRNDLVRAEEVGRSLTDEEIRGVWSAATQYGYPFGPLFQILLLTGQRKGEWAEATRSAVNTEQNLLEIPRAKYKGRRDHIVPMSDPVWEIFQRLPVFEGNDYYLFSTMQGRTPVSGFSTAKRRLDGFLLKGMKEAALPDGVELTPYRVHDFRVTCETRLATLGFNQEIRDAVLGHAKPGLQKIYNKHDYLQEKRAALAAYGNHILDLCGRA